MALPSKKISKIKTDSSNTYDVVAQYITDGSTSYALTAPTLTADNTIALNSQLVSSAVFEEVSDIIFTIENVQSEFQQVTVTFSCEPGSTWSDLIGTYDTTNVYVLTINTNNGGVYAKYTGAPVMEATIYIDSSHTTAVATTDSVLATTYYQAERVF